MGTLTTDDKYLDAIGDALDMAESQIERGIVGQNHRFRWEAILPRRKNWIQTLILLPFGLPIAHFLGSNWNFAIASIVKEHQYLTATIAIMVSTLLPSLFFACLFHWGNMLRQQNVGVAWYPNLRDLWKGYYATLTIGISCGLVELFAQSLGVCNNPAWGSTAQNLLCNLDNYGFESKSWIGVWLIIAAYCYRCQDIIERKCARILPKSE